jgi:hypothetical protein
LVISGTLTTASLFAATEPSIVKPTAAAVHFQSYSLNFLTLQQNILMTPTLNLTVHGNPTLEHTPDGLTVLVLNGSLHQHVQLEKETIRCIGDLVQCHSGFTIKIEVNLLHINHTQKTYIFSNGPIEMYFEHNSLNAILVVNQRKWLIHFPFDVTVNTWHTYTLSWSTAGLTLYIDNTLVATVTQTIPTSLALTSHTFYIGTHTVDSYSTTMKIKGVSIWTTTHANLVLHGEVLG